MATLSILVLLTSFQLLLAVYPPPSATAAQLWERLAFPAADSPWVPSQNRTLVSPNRNFSAGFLPSSTACTPSSSTSGGYVFAVWVTAAADRTVVWSLDCRRPVTATSRLVLSPSGALSLNDTSGRNLWPGSPLGGPNATQLKLADGGELSLGSWSSFDYPTHTLLSNQELKLRNLTSSNGRYQLVNATNLVFNGSDFYWSTGALRQLTSVGVLLRDRDYTPVMTDLNDLRLRRITLDPDGNLRAYSLDPKSGNWSAVWQAVEEPCKIHGTCGPNAICYNNGSTLTDVTCVCPPGFRWSRGGSAGGCELKEPYQRGGSKLLRMDFVSFDGGAPAPTPLTLGACQSRCLANASCVGFTYKSTGQQNCYQYAGALANGYWSPATEVATFLLVADNETAATNFTGMATAMDTVCAVRVSLAVPPKESKTTARNLAIIGTAFGLELLAGVLAFWAFLRKYSKYRDMALVLGLEFLPAGGPKRFSYAELRAATADFSDVIGQGGFGVVYKGVLPDRRAVAVKRLKGVTGSEADFWAEVTIIARMHHLNLVRLWGFCTEKDQRLLVYEYVPNGSLDKYVFPQPQDYKSETLEGEEDPDQETPDGDDKESLASLQAQRRRKPALDWGIRYRIAVGVARAIAYLHEECLEWVLHRDIKPENILLDSDFCPKVSDFGLAKLAQGKGEERVSRSRAGPRGTQGYMAPEWVMPREPITAKVDVYSFGMVLLEMVMGARGSECLQSSVGSEEWYLPAFAYEKVFVEQSVEEVLDPRILQSYDSQAHAAMVERMVKTAMWCLQGRPEQRPSMGKVAKMLEGTVEITEPGKPTIFFLPHN